MASDLWDLLSGNELREAAREERRLRDMAERELAEARAEVEKLKRHNSRIAKKSECLQAQRDALSEALEDIAELRILKMGGERFDHEKHDRATWQEVQYINAACHARAALAEPEGGG